TMVAAAASAITGLNSWRSTGNSMTIVVGALGALAENDIRRLFGYVVISGIGNMLAGVALGGLGGISGAVFYALHSMVLMTALYL
ncbi:proton-conducting transporter transmembrane domain-containing protein, partial [Rhizobium johnstonii]|uniref:proton-conducting transporter transmembrane domain-containing protein n=1 Tax=Rhizobium johnstonii TaxID=3019933 RepID=UPI003F9B7AFC